MENYDNLPCYLYCEDALENDSSDERMRDMYAEEEYELKMLEHEPVPKSENDVQDPYKDEEAYLDNVYARFLTYQWVKKQLYK